MKIRRWIGEHLNDISVSDTTGEGRIVFPDDFSVFAGHFPGNPTLPGVCELTCAEVLLEKCTNRTLELQSLSKAKFYSPVQPGEEIHLYAVWNLADGLLNAEVRLSCGERKIAHFKHCCYILRGTFDWSVSSHIC